MFDKLIVSDAPGSDSKNRRNYFMVSSLVVGIMFTASVVVSIFAADYALGTNGIELAENLWIKRVSSSRLIKCAWKQMYNKLWTSVRGVVSLWYESIGNEMAGR